MLRKKIDSVLYIVAALLLPNIFLFNLYNQNRALNYIPFGYTFLFALVLSVVGVLVILLFHWLIGNYEIALFISLIFWLSFWFFEAIYAMILSLFENFHRWLLLAVIIIVISAIAMLFRIYKCSIENMRPVFRTFAILVCGLFLFNFWFGVSHQITLAIARRDAGFYIRRNFNIDDSLPSPDIYWFHMDGMLSLSVIERYFGENQDSLREALTSRGFVIHEDGLLNAGSTTLAFPALFSPGFYDSYFGAVLAEHERMFYRTDRISSVRDKFAQSGLDIHNDILPYHELFHAFVDSGYRAVWIGTGLGAYRPFAYRFYLNHGGPRGICWTYGDLMIVFDNDASRFSIGSFLSRAGSLPDLVVQVTPFSMLANHINILAGNQQRMPVPMHQNVIDRWGAGTLNHMERQIYRMLYDSFTAPSPKIVFCAFYFAHSYLWGAFAHEGSTVQSLYLRAHNRAVITMINAIDMVFEQNPYAIIVLQSDHGIHSNTRLRELLDMGYSEDEVLELWHSVFSAVRIPSRYGGLYAPLEPLNISRELVNRFVGENYSLIRGD